MKVFMKKIICVLLAMLLCCFAFAACGGSDGNSSGGNAEKKADPAKAIVGTWEYENGGYTYVFNNDGTGEYVGKAFTYTVDGNKISILYDGNTAPFETEFSIEGNKLNVKDSLGDDTIYIKK